MATDNPNQVAVPDARDITLAHLLGWDIEAAARLRRELKEVADAEHEFKTSVSGQRDDWADKMIRAQDAEEGYIEPKGKIIGKTALRRH